MKTKICSNPKCKLEKMLSEFGKDKNRKDGLNVYCKECVNKFRKASYLKNKVKIAKRAKQYRDKNKVKIAKQNKKYQDKNKVQIRKYNTKYKRDKRKQSIELRLKENLRNRIFNALNGNDKSLNTMTLIGCEIDYLMFYIQNKFVYGMSWDNYGLWHIDHIKPCSLFDLSDPEVQRKCFNYNNLQPLWAIDNLRKSNKYIVGEIFK